MSTTPLRPDVKPLIRGMRVLYLVAAGLVFIAGVQLFVLSEQTERYFAWTVNPPLTAAFLGAAFWAACALEVVAARRQAWADARIAAAGVLVFSTMTLAATLIHLDRFHLDRLAGWAWVAVYAAVPPALLALLILQARAPGGDPERSMPLAGWLRALLLAQGAVMAGLGLALFIAPASTATVWPWELTPLTARAVGSWLVGLGVVAGAVAWENDARRVEPAAVSAVLLVILQAVALLRYPDTIDWSSASGWVYVVFLGSLLASGVMLLLSERRAGRAVPAR